MGFGTILGMRAIIYLRAGEFHPKAFEEAVPTYDVSELLEAHT
jgi:hypothetical protein